MKKLLLLSFVVAIAGCGSNNGSGSTPPDSTKTEPAQTNDSNEQTPVGPPGTGLKTELKDENGDKGILFIGTSAKWTKSTVKQFDGKYDTAHKLFMACDDNNTQEVPIGEIRFPQYATCDQVGYSLRMIKINKNGNLDPNGIHIELEGTKGVTRENGVKRYIELDPKTIKRIEKTGYRKGTTYDPNLELKNEGNKVTTTPGKIILTDKTLIEVKPGVVPVTEVKTQLKPITVQPGLLKSSTIQKVTVDSAALRRMKRIQR